MYYKLIRLSMWFTCCYFVVSTRTDIQTQKQMHNYVIVWSIFSSESNGENFFFAEDVQKSYPTNNLCVNIPEFKTAEQNIIKIYLNLII